MIRRLRSWVTLFLGIFPYKGIFLSSEFSFHGGWVSPLVLWINTLLRNHNFIIWKCGMILFPLHVPHSHRKQTISAPSCKRQRCAWVQGLRAMSTYPSVTSFLWCTPMTSSSMVREFALKLIKSNLWHTNRMQRNVATIWVQNPSLR